MQAINRTEMIMNRLPKKILTLLALIICFIGVKAEDGKGEKWTEMLTNGDAEMPWDDPNVSYDDMQNNYKICAWGKENGRNASSPFPCDIVELPEGGHAFIVRATDCTNPDTSWDNQFWIQSPQEWKAGSRIKIHFRYKASQDAKVVTQVHKQGPGDYLYYQAVGDINFTTEWQEFDGTMIVDNNMDGMWSIAFNLNEVVKDAMDFYFDDLSWKYLEHEEGKEPIEINPNPTEIVVHAVERDDLADDDDGTINEEEGGTGHFWDNQFWFYANRKLSAGEITTVQFRYKSSIPAHTTTEGHAAPGEYLSWGSIGDIDFTEEWQNFEKVFVVPTDADGMQSIAFDMAHIREACDYYIKDVVWKLADNTESLINEEGFDNFYVREGADAEIYVYDPNGYSPPTTYILSIKATGNGSASYNETTIRSQTSTFTVNKGTSATVTFSPDAGYRIASVILNGTDVTSSVVSNKYTISNITKDTNVEVLFEEIPATTYTLSITSSGNGYVSYDGNSVRGKTSSFSVAEGTNAILKFSADEGNKLKSVKVNGEDVTSTIVNNQYTINSVKTNTTIEVVFEANPNYTLKIVAMGNGKATYNGTTIRKQDKSFTLTEGASAVISFTPDAGYGIKSVTVNGTDAMSQVVNGQITISNITANTSLVVTFAVMPPSTYTLSITSLGNGYVTYDGNTVRGKTSSFSVAEGTNAILKFSADEGNRLKSVKVNGQDVTSTIVNNQYTINSVKANTTIEVVFEANPNYTLKIVAMGNGKATYNGTTIRKQDKSFTLTEGASAVISFTPDAGYGIKSVTVNGTDAMSQVVNGQITISNITANTSLVVTFDVMPPATYTLSITSSGNGYVAYDGNTVRGKTSSFSVAEGTNAILKFSADEGNKLKSVKVNGEDVTSTIVNNQYTIDNVTANTTIEVVFEAIPNYSLNIVATGNGKVTYKGTVIRNQSQSFTLREGTSAIISFTPDTGYRIKSVAVNSTDVTSQVVNEQFTVSNIKKNTNVEVSFEEIPPTNYSLTIKATGNGAVTYDGQSIRGGSSTFTVVEGSYATVQIIADDGYRLKHVLLDSKTVTANVADGQYTITKIMANMTLAVEFEAIPAYTLTIKSSAFGSVKYGDAVITDQTQTFTVTEGASAMLTFMPDGNGRLQYITLNGNDITGQLSNGQYTINNIKADQSVEAVYDVDITKVTNAGVAYTVTSYDEQTVVVAAGNYGQVLTVPATFEEKGKTWKVTGLAEDALSSANELAAIIWDPEVPFTAEVSNPNLLLYVKNAEYAPTTIQNVVVGNQAESIVLTEAVEGNNFYCPRAFTAKYISYEHNYIMITGYKSCQGWETIVLPFDVSMMISSKGKELVPHTGWQAGSNQRPFWLYQLTSSGWQAADGIRANVPYIISMPNNEIYQSSYNIAGNVQFIGNDVEVKASDNMAANQYGNWRLMGNYQNGNANSSIYALNVNNLWSQNTDTEVEGSAFIRNLRTVHPFEAYLTLEGSRASQRVISIFDDNLATAIYNVSWVKVDGSDNDNWYTLDGRKLQGEPTQKGIYIYKGKKVKK